MKKLIIALALAATTLSGCTRIETGEAGVRRGWDKQIETEELLPGSFNQVMIGDVMHFPVKEVPVNILNQTPLAHDDSTLEDFDATIIYSLNPTTVAELYAEKSPSFHIYNENEGRTYLMGNYVHQLGRSAIYKVARKYGALEMNDKRAVIENQIQEEVNKGLKVNKLDGSITINQVIVRKIQPAKGIIAEANLLVKAEKERQRKEVEVETAKLEAERIAALNTNKSAVDYMKAMAAVNISEAIKEGKVTTVVVPSDFGGMLNLN